MKKAITVTILYDSISDSIDMVQLLGEVLPVSKTFYGTDSNIYLELDSDRFERLYSKLIGKMNDTRM